jgi:hypothetical protein
MPRKVAEKFATPDGQIVDVIFATSDGEPHFSHKEAVTAANKLIDRKITPYYKDQKIRELGDQHYELQKMIVVTDYLKLMRLQKKNPTYAEYLATCKELAVAPVTEDIYKFVESKVFRSRRMIAVGQPDTIFTYKKGIVEAHFLRQYPQGKMWILGNDIVMTCPTHTELGRISFYDIFGQVLGTDPEKIKKEEPTK